MPPAADRTVKRISAKALLKLCGQRPTTTIVTSRAPAPADRVAVRR